MGILNKKQDEEAKKEVSEATAVEDALLDKVDGKVKIDNVPKKFLRMTLKVNCTNKEILFKMIDFQGELVEEHGLEVINMIGTDEINTEDG